ncbi:secretoglobin family 3A member 1 [Echinops telfairi]|uniref:Secretoglobin family 3A member 1 n=1 Tax=Echinops telfairi TaxID=9371 RepID=A0ABM0ZQR8_ECHTE|nr:secretoglobin family 3A member 1 [Echinops telfairi]
MKLAAAFLGLCVALLSNTAAAFLVDTVFKPVDKPVAAIAPAAEAVVDAVASPLLRPFNPLKLMLASMGVPVDRLLEGSTRCLAELGPETVGVLKTLMGALTYFG